MLEHVAEGFAAARSTRLEVNRADTASMDLALMERALRITIAVCAATTVA